MTANDKSKLKLLSIMEMLQEETDAEHGLSMRQIISKLAEEGIDAERKSVYRDLKTLEDFGLKIKKFQRNPVEYALDPRDFSLSDLMLMVDAVASSKFLTEKQAGVLIGNIQSLASEPQREQLDRSGLHVVGRITAESNGVFEAIDLIHQALRERREISFLYLHYGLDGERHPSNDGKPHEVTPMEVTYADGFYYLTGWDEGRQKVCQYRIDRMDEVQLLDAPASRDERISEYSAELDDYEYFGRFEGKEVAARLAVDGNAVEIIRDRFGPNAEIWPDPDGENAIARVKVRASVQFYGWVAGLNRKVTVAGPSWLVDEYRAYLRKLLDD